MIGILKLRRIICDLTWLDLYDRLDKLRPSIWLDLHLTWKLLQQRMTWLDLTSSFFLWLDLTCDLRNLWLAHLCTQGQGPHNPWSLSPSKNVYAHLYDYCMLWVRMVLYSIYISMDRASKTRSTWLSPPRWGETRRYAHGCTDSLIVSRTYEEVTSVVP